MSIHHIKLKYCTPQSTICIVERCDNNENAPHALPFASLFLRTLRQRGGRFFSTNITPKYGLFTHESLDKYFYLIKYTFALP